VLKWAKENKCYWSYWATAGAAEKGHGEVLKWQRENGCPWHHTITATAGNLELLKWATEQGCPWGSDTLLVGVCENAAVRVGKSARV